MNGLPSGSSPTAAMDANLTAAAATYGTLPGAQGLDVPGVVGVVTDVPLGFFNLVATTDLRDDDADAAIASVLARFAARRAPCRWWVTPSSRPADLGERLARHGMHVHYTAPAMVADLGRSELAGGLPPGAAIVRVRERAELERLSRVLMAAFEEPATKVPAWVDTFAALGLDGGAPWQHFLATIDGEPLATASVLLGGGVAGLYHVGTLPHARGRGLGRAVTVAALLAARDRGFTSAVLQSSAEAFGLYRSLGFHTVAEVAAYEKAAAVGR
jgi:ribosomal protein S18 acetylase RimI-like enzyme